MSDDALTPEELERNEPEVLPDREAMSVIRMPSPDPVVFPVPAPGLDDTGQ